MTRYDTVKLRLLEFVGARAPCSHAQLGAGILDFLNRVSSGVLYGDMPSRQDLEGLLRDLVAALAREDYLINGPSLAPLKGLTAIFMRHDKDHLAVFMNKAGAVDSAQRPRFDTLTNILDAVPSREMPDSFPDMICRITHRPQQRMGRVLSALYGMADTIENNATGVMLGRTYLSEKGPLDIRELIFILNLYAQALQTPRYQRMFSAGHTAYPYNSSLSLAAEIRFLVRDLTLLANDIQMEGDSCDIGRHETDDFLKTVSFRPEHVIALTRYYVEHHRDRLNKHQYNAIERQLSRVFFQCHLVQTKAHDFQSVQLANAAQTRRRDAWVELSRPSVTDTLLRLADPSEKNRKQAQKYLEFDAQRAMMPPGMEEVVTLYYPENESIRKTRSHAFKAKYHGTREGAKRSFIRHVAICYGEELKRHYNVTEAEISQLRHGTIPETVDLTVEHITDRKFGGTNHFENLIIMPRWINDHKERMIQAQMAALGPLKEPTWIITWHPVRDRFGNFPDLYLPPNGIKIPSLSPKAACTMPEVSVNILEPLGVK